MRPLDDRRLATHREEVARLIAAAARADGWFVFAAGQVARCPAPSSVQGPYCGGFVLEVEAGEVWVRVRQGARGARRACDKCGTQLQVRTVDDAVAGVA